MISSLLYVSTSLLARSEADSGVADIIAVSRERNIALGVTGCLVLAQNHFAQVLEGERAALDQLMVSINRDHRHTGINVVDVCEIPERRFTGWSMAYAGPSTYVDRHILALLPALQEAETRAATVDRLITLMREFLAANSRELQRPSADRHRGR